MAVVTVFGGSGFLGRYVVRHLARRGWRVKVATRRPNDALFLKTAGDVGQIDVLQANIRDEASTERAIIGSDAVINLVGILYQTSRQRFDTVQYEGAERIARLAAAHGVKALAHISAIGADAESEIPYQRTKGAAEQAVRKHFPRAAILRPSIIFGPEDEFFNKFAGMSRFSPVLPVIGGETKFQPVYVDDVALAILEALKPESSGHVYELGGPEILTMREMLQKINEVTYQDRFLLDIPMPIARIMAFFTKFLPKPPMTPDQLKMLEKDNIADDAAPGLEALGVAPTALDAILPDYLYRFRPYGQYARNRQGSVAP